MKLLESRCKKDLHLEEGIERIPDIMLKGCSVCHSRSKCQQRFNYSISSIFIRNNIAFVKVQLQVLHVLSGLPKSISFCHLSSVPLVHKFVKHKV